MKYEISEQIAEVKNYCNESSAFFKTFKDDVISKFIQGGVPWEIHNHRTFLKYINKDSIVLEGGAHIGTHTIFFSKLVNHVYCFEPLKQSAQLLQENLQINNCDNVTVYNCGLSDKKLFDSFGFIPSHNIGGAGMINNPLGIPLHFGGTDLSEDERVPIELVSIDEMFNFDKLDFIKLDVEGYEQNVILGAYNTIKKCKPVIMLENWDDHFGNVDIDSTSNKFSMLLDLGYAITQVSHCDFLFVPTTNIQLELL